jgi:uncharacterized protein
VNGVPIEVRWRDWSGQSLERLTLTVGVEGICVRSTIESPGFTARVRIDCDAGWRVRTAEIALANGPTLSLAADGAGSWRDADGSVLSQLDGAIDIDLAASPFTNTLPIRRLNLEQGEAAEITVAYVSFPELDPSLDRQRYTCIEPMRRYLFEAVDGTFDREIEVDGDGLVVTYPGLFRRA